MYVTCLEELGVRLEARGLTLGRPSPAWKRSRRPPPPPSWGAGLVPICPAGGLAGVPLVQAAGPWLDPGGGSCGGIGGLVTGAARMDAEGADAALCGGLPLCGRLVDCAVCPAGAVQALPALAGLGWDSGHGAGPGWSLLGGLHVAALMASRSYLMGAQIFSGVKVALLLPIVFAALGLLYVLRQEIVAAWRRSWLPILLAVPCSAGFAASSCCGRGLVGALFRPGDHPAQRVGDGLYARPRSKELFLAAPCVPLFLWACRRKVLFFQFFCGVGVCLSAFPWSTPSATGWRRWGCP